VGEDVAVVDGGESSAALKNEDPPVHPGMIWRYLIEVPWIVFVAYWGVGALKTRKTVQRESFASRYGVLFLEILGFVLLFSGTADIGVLGNRAVPRTYPLAITGVALTWIGIAIALWARWHLGHYWSARVTLKEDHKLICTGPYAYFRHPIYSGLDLAAVGGALAIDEWRCVAGVCLIVVGYWIKARKEESMLTAQFGEAFEEHCRHTGFLIPKFW
jgi:protein-S-isoprenylcysteine O-methyltransferase Ste14